MSARFHIGDMVIIDHPSAINNGIYGRIEAINHFYHETIFYEVSFLGDRRTFLYYEYQLKPAQIPYHSIENVVRDIFEIEKVLFNCPATIVFWKDGTKTVVKCGDDECYDPEKGLAMAISKKALGNQGNYYEVFKKYLKEYETHMLEIEKDFNWY